MNATVSGRLFPQILRSVNRAAEVVRPEGLAAAALDRARDGIADVAAKRIQLENKVRMIQAYATRGRGMTRADLDSALEGVVQDLREL